MRLASVALLVAGSSLSCTPTAPATAPAAPVAPSPTGPFVEIVANNNYADERDSTRYVVRDDGSFDSEHVMSNGGGTSEVTTCTGRLPAAEASAWVARVRAGATHATPPRGMDRNEAAKRRIPRSFTVAYVTRPSSTTYADPATWTSDLEALASRLSKAATCQRSTR